MWGYAHLSTLIVPVFDTFSPWWLLLCAFAGACYAYFQYRIARQKDLSRSLLYTLSLFRFLTVSLLSALLLSPLVEQTLIRTERPVIVLAMDNSASIKARPSPAVSITAFSQAFASLASSLSRDYEVKTYSFGQQISERLQFDAGEKQTDLGSLLTRVYSTYENRNLGAVILASDGIINSGADPLALVKTHAVPIYPIPLGDTTALKDLAVIDVRSSDIVYEGQSFTMQVFVKATEAAGSKATLKVDVGDRQVFSRVIPINSNDFNTSVPVRLTSDKLGFTTYTVRVLPVAGEKNIVNNRRQVVIETLKGKLRILLLAGAPHPDLTFLKQTLQNFKKSDVELIFPPATPHLSLGSYDLIILHQIPFTGGEGFSQLSRYTSTKTPVWFLFGSQTDVQRFNQIQKNVQVIAAFAVEQMQAVFNPLFSFFTLSDSAKKQLEQVPALLGPVGSYKVSNLSASLLNVQGVAKANKEQPLLFFTNEAKGKAAYLMGEGLWRWNLKEYNDHNTHKGIGEVIDQTVQYLTAEADKRKFRITMPQRIYAENESPEMNAELLNDNFEQVNGPDAFLDVLDAKKRSYPFTFSRTANAYSLKTGPLPPGEYSYTGRVMVKGKTEHAQGSFVIKRLDVEGLDLNANHTLLRALAAATAGKTVAPARVSTIPELLRRNQQIASISHQEQSREEAINLKWIFFLALGLLAAEWFTRKFNGFL